MQNKNEIFIDPKVQVSRSAMNLIDKLIALSVYSWKTKRWASKPGLIDSIGTIEDPLGLSAEQAYRIWNTKSTVDSIELFMDVGRIYVSFVSNAFIISHASLIMRYGIWIKIPTDKKRYLKNLEVKNHLGKRKRDSNSHDRHTREEDADEVEDDDKVEGKTYKVEHDLLASRTLQELLQLTESDAYIQLGDLNFELHESNTLGGHRHPGQAYGRLYKQNFRSNNSDW